GAGNRIGGTGEALPGAVQDVEHLLTLCGGPDRHDGPDLSIGRRVIADSAYDRGHTCYGLRERRSSSPGRGDEQNEGVVSVTTPPPAASGPSPEPGLSPDRGPASPPGAAPSPTPEQFQAVQKSEEFGRLRSSFRSFAIPMTV